MASSTAAASSFSLLHSSSLSTRSPAAARLTASHLPSLYRLVFSGTTTTADPAFSGHDLSNFHFFNYFSAKPIRELASIADKCLRNPSSGDLKPDLSAPLIHTDHIHNLAPVPTVNHLINNGARASGNLVRKKIEDMTYQLTDAHSKYRQSPLSRVSGFATVAVTLLPSRSFCSRPSNPLIESQGPSPIDYCSVLQEDEFHKLADSTIHDLLEKPEEYGDSIDIDGFDIDYGNEVLTLKLGDLGTYVVNKQTPNRQIWLSSPVSGPSRFDWDPKTQAWIYRRDLANLFKLLESEIEKLCGQPLKLS